MDVPTLGKGQKCAKEALLQSCPLVGLCLSVTVEQTKVFGGRAVLVGTLSAVAVGHVALGNAITAT